MPEGEVRGGVEHGEGGKFQDKYEDDDVVQALVEAYPEPLTNKEVSEAVGCAKATAHNRLHDLLDEGIVYTKEPGARARVWWVDMTEPAPENSSTGIREFLEDSEREEVLQVASHFKPPFNPTRTGTDEVIDYILEQPWGEVNRAIEQVLNGELESDD